MPTPYLIPDLKRFEGCALTSFWDPIGKCWTIAYGHTEGVVEGQTCSQATADTWLALDVGAAVRALDADPATQGWWQECGPVRGDAFIELSFNLGERTLDEFKHMLAAAQAGDWNTCADQAIDSDWYREVNGDGRGDWIVAMLRNNARPTLPTT